MAERYLEVSSPMSDPRNWKQVASMRKFFAKQRTSGVFSGGWDVFDTYREGSNELTECSTEDATLFVVLYKEGSHAIKHPNDIKGISPDRLVPVVGSLVSALDDYVSAKGI